MLKQTEGRIKPFRQGPVDLTGAFVRLAILRFARCSFASLFQRIWRRDWERNDENCGVEVFLCSNSGGRLERAIETNWATARGGDEATGFWAGRYRRRIIFAASAGREDCPVSARMLKSLFRFFTLATIMLRAKPEFATSIPGAQAMANDFMTERREDEVPQKRMPYEARATAIENEVLTLTCGL